MNTTDALITKEILTPNFVGIGSQYNQNLYAPVSKILGINEQNVKDLEQKVLDLKCQHVRIFFSFKDLDTKTYPEREGRLSSFYRTVALAQKTGCSVNITYWHGPYDQPKKQMRQFVDILQDVVEKRKMTCVQYITIQNEPNSTKMPLSKYGKLYRLFDAELKNRGLRSQFTIVGGDLLLPQQKKWYTYMARYLSPILDGYSSHIYWQYDDKDYAKNRLIGIKELTNAMPKQAQRPLYITEFGMRADLITRPRPGLIDGVPTSDTLINAFQHAWFVFLALNMGFTGLVKWDAYRAQYDNAVQDFAMITSANEGHGLRPVYHQTKLITHTCHSGWHVMKTINHDSQKQVTALGNGKELTIYTLNDSEKNTTITISGLPKNQTFNLYFWNQKANGLNSFAGSIQTNEKGDIAVNVPFQSFAALTTLSASL